MNSPEGLSFESKEKLRYHYTFTDGSVLECPSLFECDASDDVEAQDKFLTFIEDSGMDISESEIRRSRIVK